ncbi:Auxin-induced protein 10A5 [Morella rubra]|uniref:Auxin-induced protein 10A5 n=1 Tax=Morella rubra TaxID=262757 RepID=A0A6A1V5Y9_9ROSI|nr:Auxin-induced protein 10A5 [Morella rubra]
MISLKKLIKIARKWQKKAAIGRKRVTFPSTNGTGKVDVSNTSAVSKKGHFVIYTTDERRFEMPLAYLNNPIFLELFKKSEEEFGLPSDGPITLPCDAVFMNHVILLVQRGAVAAYHLEKTLLNSIATRRCSVSASHRGHAGQNLLISAC